MSKNADTYEPVVDDTNEVKDTDQTTHVSFSENKNLDKNTISSTHIENQGLPIKRGPGRPRKYPLPVQPKPITYASQPAYTTAQHAYVNPEIEKYMMKKKVKKYVQHYLSKYGHPSVYSSQHQQQQSNVSLYDEADDEDEEGMDYDDMEMNKENIKPSPPHSNASSHVPQDRSSNAYVPTSNSKLDQILGRNRRKWQTKKKENNKDVHVFLNKKMKNKPNYILSSYRINLVEHSRMFLLKPA